MILSHDPYSDENLKTLENKLGISIKNKELLKTAITTRAARNEHPEVKEDNERLEFLGDSVLKFLLSENLYKHKPKPEGTMTIMRTEIENNITLGSIAKELEIKPHLFLGKGERSLTGKSEQKILADSLEAIIGAIYLDKEDLEETRRFIERKMLNELLQILLTRDIKDPITPLQEITQKEYGKPPKYLFSKMADRSNIQLFKADIFLNDEKISEAEGTSRKDAKKKAAKKALIKLTN